VSNGRVFKRLRTVLESYLDEEQIDRVHSAFLFGAAAHTGQKRHSGEPYITHPIAVAGILAQMHLDPESLIAAILHDVIEDTGISKATLTEKFGKSVAELVDGVTKLTQIKFESQAEAQAENFRKMVLAMVKDIRVILIKLADRLHNMRTLGVVPPEKRQRIAKETLEIYAPIANRLGMHAFATEFQELGFSILHPNRYRILTDAREKAHGHRKEIMKVIENALQAILKKDSLSFESIEGREKHIFSIYKKMRNKRLTFAEIMDVYGFRIVVNSRDACYRVLGSVHSLYKPVPERFKDYIAIPKANGYQSLHTTLFGPYGVPIEIQIRSKEMHFIAENGIAAHWLYKSGESADHEAQVHTREWLRNLLEMQQSTGNSLEFIENVKIDLFPDEVYVFTPKGEIKKLPAGATAVDFAYAVHSDIGNSCVAVKINRRLAPLSSVLSNGVTVEIITAANTRPNPAWLNFVVTAKARSHIRHFLKNQRVTESISLGTRLLEKALATMSLTINDIPEEALQAVLGESHYKNKDELLENIGLGNQMPLIVARRLALFDETEEKPAEDNSKQQTEPLPIKGSEGMVLIFAPCCRPIPGDAIVGFLTTGKGIVVHIETCSAVAAARTAHQESIDLIWDRTVEDRYKVDVLLYAENRRGVLAALARGIAEADSDILDISVEEQDGLFCRVNLTLLVIDKDHLTHIMQRLRAARSVERIARR
jgi:RelA/SpoT family (p)ppGpp synthetase